MSNLDELLEECGSIDREMASLRDLSAAELESLRAENEQLSDRIEALETALKCASACNYKADKLAWSVSSPFQQEIINELVGPPPYGDK
jgi:hypothetical protein